MSIHLCKVMKTLNPSHKKTFNYFLTYNNIKLPSLNHNYRNLKTRSNFKVWASQMTSSTNYPKKLKSIIESFQMVPDPMERYKQLLYFASKLDPLPKEYQTAENKVVGCVSQVWVKAKNENGTIIYQADSDSQLTKGLAALLINGLSGCTAKEILSVDPNFIELLGLKQSLTPSRNNGFLNMFKLMQRKAIELAKEDIKLQSVSKEKINMRPIENEIRRKLMEELKPETLEIINESEKHVGHVGNPLTKTDDGTEVETHFKIKIISNAFENKTLIQRHRMVYAIIDNEIKGSVHACSLETKTPNEISNLSK